MLTIKKRRRSVLGRILRVPRAIWQFHAKRGEGPGEGFVPSPGAPSRRALALAAAAAVCLALTGCGPPGLRALRRGDRLVQSGKYEEAIKALTQATNLLAEPGATNFLAKESVTAQARARNLLGLAYHRTGDTAGARACYEAALDLDRNAVAEANYNLGCLELEQSNWPAARDALTTYTSLRARDLNGFLKLGMVSYRLAMRTPPAANAAAESARQLNFENSRKAYESSKRIKLTAEAWNNLAMIDLLRKPNPPRAVVTNAVAELKAALDCDAHYAPALLNLAVVYDPSGPYKYGDVQSALSVYRRYLALNPPPPHTNEVALVVSNLVWTDRFTVQRPGQTPEQPGTTASSNRSSIVLKTNPPARAATPLPAPPPAPAASNPPTVAIIPPPASTSTNPPTVAILPARAPAPTNPPSVAMLTPSRPAEPPPPRPATDGSRSNTLSLPAQGGPSPGNLSAGPAVENTDTATGVAAAAPRKPSLLARLFGAKPKPAEGGAQPAAAASGNPGRVTPLPAPHAILHYDPPPVSTNSGNRAQAERLISEGAAAERDSRWSSAVDSYQEAVRADPACYEACEALGMVAIKSENYAIALEALHHALALNAESANARYAYAWVLEKKDYLQDAANELERLLAQHPEETRAHLLLGKLYAEKLRQPDFARGHYKKVLEQDPGGGQTAAIRAWLQNNPEP